ncbi:hypothetical protein BALOs_0127 [Halobacteriovorax sp. BALOs_7]|nr:hypothetical protein [Halobacteriovorax sp. BALOs_7]AYF43148.1 hypothetical protein BALOs_0127 [Halobacteriovorax sp. BALOs_7]
MKKLIDSGFLLTLLTELSTLDYNRWLFFIVFTFTNEIPYFQYFTIYVA